jgi:hypothetical protein
MQYWRLLGPGCAEEKEGEEEGRRAAGLFLQINQISSVTAGIHSIVERRGDVTSYHAKISGLDKEDRE